MIDVLQGAASGLGNLFIWQTFLFMMAGILIGMFFGLVPGLNGLIGMALLLPLAITMSPENAVAFLLGMYAVTTQTDAIPAVLIGLVVVAASGGAPASAPSSCPTTQPRRITSASLPRLGPSATR